MNVAPVAGVRGFARHCAYTASKHEVIGVTEAAAIEYARKGIRVNAMCPGFTRTPMVEEMLLDRPGLEERLLRDAEVCSNQALSLAMWRISWRLARCMSSAASASDCSLANSSSSAKLRPSRKKFSQLGTWLNNSNGVAQRR